MKTEFEFIRSLQKEFSLEKIGDDCAVLPKDERTDLVITTDLLVEEIDFRLEWTRPQFLGHKALAVSLSDVAAMGAKPVWAMLSLGVPERVWKSGFVEEFYEGWFDLARRFGVELVGGDVSKTPDKIVIDSIAAGEVKKGNAVLRSGARVGDFICITGELGDAAMALKLLEEGERYEKSDYKSLLLRQLAPNPQTEIGQIIGEENLATAMIDLSDGFSSDLFRICEASKVGAKIYAEKVPIELQITNSKIQNSKLNTQNSKLNFALNGGEDFELLFTVNSKKFFQLQKHLDKSKISIIGEISANTEIIELITDKKIEILKPKGFRHF